MLVPTEYTSLQPAALKFSPAIKALAFVFSVIFHPVFIPVIAVAYLAFIHQGYFIGMPQKEKVMILVRVGVNTLFFPMITVLLLKGLGFIKSIMLRDKKDRIIPYASANIFYFWMFLVFVNQPEVPKITTSFILGVFIASSLALILNSFFKISMHALGMGALAGLLILIVFSGFPSGTFLPLMIVLLLSGIVCSSRLVLSDHTLFDINSGFVIGVLCQVVAGYFIGA